MRDIKLSDTPLVRMTSVTIERGGAPGLREVPLNLLLEISGFGTPHDDLTKVYLDVILKITAPKDNTIDGRFKMRCILSLAQSLSVEELKNKSILQDIVRVLVKKSLDQISFSVSTMLTQFGVGSVALSTLINVETLTFK